MIDQPHPAQGAARIPTGRRESPAVQTDEMHRLSMPCHRPLHDWISTRIAWPVEDVDLLSANR
ncbi:hypothetical protein A4R44_04071 [Amycolatopsis sp. M39]|nr:hypothetical protein A4R44_04071 [Amycolatopsis sp. M39]